MQFLLIFSAIVYLSLSMIGLGRFFERLLKRWGADFPALTYGEAGFLGFMFLAFIAMLLHFLRPLLPVYGLILTLFGFTYLAVYLYRHRYQQPNRLFFVVGLIFLIALSLIYSTHTYFEFPQFDLGLYHLQNVIWNHSYALSPGLASLHHRFGFNSNWLLLSNLLYTPFDWKIGAGLANTILAVLVSLFTLEYCLVRSIKKLFSNLSNSFLFVSLLLINLTQFLSSYEFLAFKNDFPIIIITVYLTYLLLRYFEVQQQSKQKFLSLIILLIVFLLTIKFSSLPLFVVILVLLIRDLLTDRYSFKPKFLAFILIFLGLWLIRHFFLSGCLLFPITQSCFSSLPWSVNLGKIERELNWFYSWAREPEVEPDVVLADWSWFRRFWLPALVSRVDMIRLAIIFLFGILLQTFAFLKKKIEFQPGFIQILVITFFSLCGWFLVAPLIRYGKGYLTVLAVLPLSHFLVGKDRYFDKKFFNIQLLKLLMLAVIFAMTIKTGSILLRKNRALNVDWPRIGHFEVLMGFNNQGYRFYYPVGNNQCFDGPLLCTPDDSENLKYNKYKNRYYFYY